MKPRLIIVCGLLASGKTTHVKRLLDEHGAVVFSADKWMKELAVDLFDETMRAKIEGLQWKLVQELLPLGNTVIIEWGTWSRSERDSLREAARKLGAAVELHCLIAPCDVLLKRLQDRGWPDISRETINGWMESFETPSQEEMALYDKAFIKDTSDR